LEGVPERLLGQPFNILRLAFHPEGLAPRTVNLCRMGRASAGATASAIAKTTADPELIKLYNDLRSYPLAGALGTACARQCRDPPSSCGTMARC